MTILFACDGCHEKFESLADHWGPDYRGCFLKFEKMEAQARLSPLPAVPVPPEGWAPDDGAGTDQGEAGVRDDQVKPVKAPFDRKAYQRAYLRAWRARKREGRK